MPKRRMTPKRRAQIRLWQRASWSAPRRKAGVFPKTKSQRIAWYKNSGIAMPNTKKIAPMYYSGHQARIMSVGYGYPKRY